jgi:histidine triad (HIT) family protein
VSDPNCLFCKIASGAIPADIVARSAHSLVFRDLHPQAPAHMLAIPLRHARDLAEFVATAEADEVSDVLALASAAGRSASSTGYRVVTNEGADAGQSVFHVHFHVLAGRALGWPPG